MACPSERTIAALADGQISGPKRAALLKHILECNKCRSLAEEFEQIRILLTFVKVKEDGTAILEIPRPTPEFRRTLKARVRKDFEDRRARKDRVRTLVTEALEDILGLKPQAAPEPAVVGYFARRRIKPSRKAHAKQAAREAELTKRLTHILDAVLDPEMPTAKRLKLMKRIQAVLEGEGE